MKIKSIGELSCIARELLFVSESMYFEEDNVMLHIGKHSYHFIKAYTSDDVVLYIDDNRIGKFNRMVWIVDDGYVEVSLESEDTNITLRFEEKRL